MSKKVLSADNQQERLNKKNINPWYVTGFVEGEGTFHIAIYKDGKMKSGIKFIPEFHVNQNLLRINTLEKIKIFFKCGYIKENHRARKNDKTHVYVVRDRKDLISKIIPFFSQYPLISVKNESFLLFKRIVGMMEKGLHCKRNGAMRIINLAYKMNDNGNYRQVKKEDLISYLKSSETIR